MGTAGAARGVDGEGVPVSDLTLRLRDEQRQELADEARRAAQRLIRIHRAKLDELARELLAREVLDRSAIDRIMGDVPPVARRAEPGLRVAAAHRSERPGE